MIQVVHRKVDDNGVESREPETCQEEVTGWGAIDVWIGRAQSLW